MFSWYFTWLPWTCVPKVFSSKQFGIVRIKIWYIFSAESKGNSRLCSLELNKRSSMHWKNNTDSFQLFPLVHGSHPHRAKGQIFVFSHKPVLIWAVPRREHELRWEHSLTEKLLERVSIVSHHQPKVPETVKLSALSWREHRDSVSHHLLDPVLQIFPWWNWLPGILAPKFVWNWPHVTSTSQNKLWLA